MNNKTASIRPNMMHKPHKTQAPNRSEQGHTKTTALYHIIGRFWCGGGTPSA